MTVRIPVDYEMATKLAKSYRFQLEAYVSLNVRRPAWMPVWIFKRLMRMVVLEESPLATRLREL